jgi:NADPH:quinone reductase-like Zn-dependent oxidoreductase
MKAIQILSSGSKPELSNVPLPKRLSHQVMVKTHFSPIHPWDLNPHQKIRSLMLGQEGSGEIVESENSNLIGKRCAFFQPWGSFAEFVVPRSYFVLPDDLTSEQAALLNFIPLTALALHKMTFGKTFILSGANSALGKILFRISKYQRPICIVRNMDSRQEMMLLGAELVIDETRGSFHDYLNLIVKDLLPSLAIDLVSGYLPSLLLRLISNGGTVYQVGSLSNHPISNLDPQEFIQNKKNLTSFSLSSFESSLPSFYKEILSEPSIFTTKISQVFNIKDFSTGLSHSKRNAKSGKVLLKFI